MYYDLVCVCECMCVQVPTEARRECWTPLYGQGGCEPSNVAAATELVSPTRAEMLLTSGPSLWPRFLYYSCLFGIGE